MTTCGVSYTATVTGSDSDLEQYEAIKPDTEVTDVCETWTGSDYVVEMIRRYSNSPEAQASDAAVTVVYRQGVLEGYGAGGGLQDVQDAGGTSFAYVNASEAEVQASYDDPYYGVTGGGGGPQCPPNCEFAPPAEVSAQRTTTDDSLGLRHGLTRRGIRYLVNDLDEVAPSPAGNRRFRGVRAGMQVTIEVSALTELLVAEEYQSAAARLRGTHAYVWIPGLGSWVRSRSEFEGEVLGDSGQWHPHRATITFSNVTLGAS